MLRVTLLTLVITFLALYAWKDWYKSLCGLILLMVVIEHPDMPKTMLGIQGLNPWNILFVIIMLAWLASRKREGLTWDMPRYINVLLLLYMSVALISCFRMLGDRDSLIMYASMIGKDIPTTADLWSEYIINSLKWVIPGLMLFDGCRSNSRFTMALISVLAIYFLLSLEVIKHMPLSAITSGDSLTARSLKIDDKIGYHRVDLSMMLAGASWAIFATKELVSRRSHIMVIIAASLIVLFGQALTGGRTGYVTWGGVGLFVCFMRWRKYLLLAPIAVIAIALVMPAAMERMTDGFNLGTRSAYVDEKTPNLNTITAGRNVAWPYVIEKIGEAPLFGYGRLAMQRTGITAFLWQEHGDTFPHPHNAYLELLLDTGLIGALPVFVFYLVILWISLSLFRDSRSPLFISIGGVTLALVLAQLIASVGSQTFYPREGIVGMWCAIGLVLRIFLERSKVLTTSPKPNPANVDEMLWRQPT